MRGELVVGETYRYFGVIALAVSNTQVLTLHKRRLLVRKCKSLPPKSLQEYSVAQLAKLWQISVADLDRATAPYFAPQESGREKLSRSEQKQANEQAVLRAMERLTCHIGRFGNKREEAA